MLHVSLDRLYCDTQLRQHTPLSRECNLLWVISCPPFCLANKLCKYCARSNIGDPAWSRPHCEVYIRPVHCYLFDDLGKGGHCLYTHTLNGHFPFYYLTRSIPEFTRGLPKATESVHECRL